MSALNLLSFPIIITSPNIKLSESTLLAQNSSIQDRELRSRAENWNEYKKQSLRGGDRENIERKAINNNIQISQRKKFINTIATKLFFMFSLSPWLKAVFFSD